jgi:hypothetical protein
MSHPPPPPPPPPPIPLQSILSQPTSMLELFGDPSNPEENIIIPPQPYQLPIDTNILWQIQQQQQQQHQQSQQTHPYQHAIPIFPDCSKVGLTNQNGNGIVRKPHLRPVDSFSGFGDNIPTEESRGNPLGLKIFFIISAIWAMLICAAGIYMLSNDPSAVLEKDTQCDQLYVWSLLFVVFEGIYLIFLILHAFHFREANLHAKRAKTGILFLVLMMSIMMWIWGTIIINRCTCPEAAHKTMWSVDWMTVNMEWGWSPGSIKY